MSAMTKHEKQRLSTLCRYLNDATVWSGVVVSAKNRAGVHILLAEAENRATINYSNQLKG
ncbi:hypothetical protein SODG_001980 [Sodalis praecaptivus]